MKSIDVPELGVLYLAWKVKMRDGDSPDFSEAIYAHPADKENWLVAPPGFMVIAGAGFRDVVEVIVYRKVLKEDPNLKEYKLAYQYRVHYSTKTVTHVILKIIDPRSGPERELHHTEIELAKTQVGEKTIRKKRVFK